MLVGQACQGIELRSNCVLTRDGGFCVSGQMLFLMSLMNFSPCVGAERFVTVTRLACQRIWLHGVDCDFHVKRV